VVRAALHAPLNLDAPLCAGHVPNLMCKPWLLQARHARLLFDTS
jgi:hypothetical protein